MSRDSCIREPVVADDTVRPDVAIKEVTETVREISSMKSETGGVQMASTIAPAGCCQLNFGQWYIHRPRLSNPSTNLGPIVRGKMTTGAVECSGRHCSNSGTCLRRYRVSSKAHRVE